MVRNSAQASRATASPRIMLIDSHPLTRRHIASLIRSRYRAATILTAGCPDEAAASAADLLVVNVNESDPSHPAVPPLVDGIRRHFPEVPLTIICAGSGSKPPPHGVRGILPLSLPADVLVAALRLVMAGGVYFHVDAPEPETAPTPAPLATDEPDDATADRAAAADGLTSRELQVLELLRQGRANKLIAHQLRISEHTVKVYVRRIMRKLNVSNRTQAAFLELGMLRAIEDSDADIFGRADA